MIVKFVHILQQFLALWQNALKLVQINESKQRQVSTVIKFITISQFGDKFPLKFLEVVTVCLLCAKPSSSAAACGYSNMPDVISFLMRDFVTAKLRAAIFYTFDLIIPPLWEPDSDQVIKINSHI